MLYLFISVKGRPWLPFWAGMEEEGENNATGHSIPAQGSGIIVYRHQGYFKDIC